MKKDFSEIICVLDRSGSMATLWDEAVNGFNSFLEAQKSAPGTANFTLVHFDIAYDIPINGINIQDVKPICDKNDPDSVQIQPRSMTALLDALGKTIVDVDTRLEKLPKEEYPEHVIFAVITDGQENSSKEFKKSQVKEMIEQRAKFKKWQFVFLSADMEAMTDSHEYGFQVNNTISFAPTAKGFHAGYDRLSAYTCSTRSGEDRTLREDDEDAHLNTD